MKLLWITLLSVISVATAQQHIDCGITPSVEHATVTLEDEEDVVIATYKCEKGFTLRGEKRIFCDLNTDEWQDDPPVCEIVEQTTSVGTLDSDASAGRQQETDTRTRKKGQEIPEDEKISSEFARELDMSCIGKRVKAPNIDNGRVVKYDRRRKGGNVFLVAFYSCNRNYELEDLNHAALYCSQQSWIGSPPVCVSTDDYGDDYDGEEEEEEGEEEKEDEEEIKRQYEREREEQLQRLHTTEQTNYEKQVVHESETPIDNTIATGHSYIEEHVKQEGGETYEEKVRETEDNEERHGQESSRGTQTGYIVEGHGMNPEEPERREEDGRPGEDEGDYDEREDTVTHEERRENAYEENVEAHISNYPKVVNESCAPDRGGCDHECHLVLYSPESVPRAECTCYSGFTLDSNDQRTCHDIDECQTNNGGCEQICINVPGSFDCSCERGLQIDTVTGNTCVDVDECQNPEIASKCPYGCENLPGSYRCLENTNGGGEEEEEDVRKNEQEEDDDEEAEEEEEAVNRRVVDHSEQGAPKEECRDGYRRNDFGDCEDIDECAEGTSGCQHCKNVAGGFECTCPEGYEMKEDDRTCQDINECEAYAGEEDEDPAAICSHQCVNLIGSFQCRCPENFHLHSDLRTCIRDYCEDLINPGLNKTSCSHSCEDGSEGFVCTCPAGYVLDTDFKTCIETDECARSDGHSYCSPGKCINAAGHYTCICPSGYVAKEGRCHDIDECFEGSDKCSHVCTNNEGSYECSCPDGLRLSEHDYKNCVDVDECAEDQQTCGDLICQNAHGSYKCVCPEGQEMLASGGCGHSDACAANNGGCSHMCTSHNGFPECACPSGMILSGDSRICVTHDPCQQDNGGCSQVCDSRLSGRCSCEAGYELHSDGRTCMDRDECQHNNGGCTQICVNQPGSYVCACEAGFDLQTDLHTCIDVNECTLNIHDCSHFCINNPGGYECSCPLGYNLGRNKFICEDINECELTFNGGCSNTCVNTLGSFHCECPTGHTLASDNRTCIDIDECGNSNKKCSHDCRNIVGGYECLCPAGYILAQDQLTCVDIDECIEHESKGGCSHECENTQGSFICVCPYGYELGENKRTCYDIDECLENNGGCSQFCVNFDGGFKCDCPRGEKLDADGKTCQSQDPCMHFNGGCDHICEVEDQHPKCACRPGFVLDDRDSRTCHDIDECRVSNPCSQACINTVGSYECGCHAGHTADARGECVDIDECQVANGGCSPQAECLNTPGSHKCMCPAGTKLAQDKKTCLEIQDRCTPIRPPRNGEIHCTRSRHKTQLFYRTRCSVWCHKGYKLEGPSTRHCNGTGHWDDHENFCNPVSCPSLPKPQIGVILPTSCHYGEIYAGERCILQCPPGYAPAGKRAAICNADQTWSTNSSLECLPVEPVDVIETSRRLDTAKPFIQCPRDTIVILPKGQRTIHVRLEQPKTNVDFIKYVDSHPEWGKHLEAHLGVGVHVMTFRARSPESSLNALCRTVITVKEPKPPLVTYCPASFDVQLRVDEHARSVTWKEPVFQSHVPLKQIYKSKMPGERLSAGVHNIVYVATDRDGQSSKCEFHIAVKGYPLITAPYGMRQTTAVEGGYQASRLENHESYLLCPGKPAMKIETNYPIHVPVGCFIKNVRLNPLLHHHQRRHQRVYNSNLLRHYASWNDPFLEKKAHALYKRKMTKSFGPMM